LIDADVTELSMRQEYGAAMKRSIDRPKTIADAIDEIERIREDLLILQRSMERIEIAEPGQYTPSDVWSK
jgi:hypothetical protein